MGDRGPGGAPPNADPDTVPVPRWLVDALVEAVRRAGPAGARTPLLATACGHEDDPDGPRSFTVAGDWSTIRAGLVPSTARGMRPWWVVEAVGDVAEPPDEADRTRVAALLSASPRPLLLRAHVADDAVELSAWDVRASGPALPVHIVDAPYPHPIAPPQPVEGTPPIGRQQARELADALRRRAGELQPAYDEIARIRPAGLISSHTGLVHHPADVRAADQRYTAAELAADAEHDTAARAAQDRAAAQRASLGVFDELPAPVLARAGLRDGLPPATGAATTDSADAARKRLAGAWNLLIADHEASLKKARQRRSTGLRNLAVAGGLAAVVVAAAAYLITSPQLGPAPTAVLMTPGMAADPPSPPAPARPAASSGTSTRLPAATPTASPAGTSAVPRDAAAIPVVEAFFVELDAAYRSGNVDWLEGSLHAAVIDAYSIAACRSAIEEYQAADFSTTVRSVSGPRAWTYKAAQSSRRIPTVYTVSVSRVRMAETSIKTVHLAVVDGELRWFSNC